MGDVIDDGKTNKSSNKANRSGRDFGKDKDEEEHQKPWQKFKCLLNKVYVSHSMQMFHTLVLLIDCLLAGWEVECLSRYKDCLENNIADMQFYADYVTSVEATGWMVIILITRNTQILKEPIVLMECVFVSIFHVFGLGIAHNIAALQRIKLLAYFLRYGRVIRMTYVLKTSEVMRELPIFEDFYILVRGLRDSPHTLLSSVIIIGCLVFVFGVILCACIGQTVANSGPMKELQVEFSTILGSMMTLLQVFFMDDAGEKVSVIAQENLKIWAIVLCFCGFGVILLMNLIMAVIVNQAMVFTSSDKELKAKTLQKEKEIYTRKVISFFNRLDVNANGKLKYEEFAKAFDHQEIRNDLQAVGVEITELKELFFILDTSNTEELAVADYVAGMQRIRGQATSRDLLMIMQSTRRVQKNLEKMNETWAKNFSSQAVPGQKMNTRLDRLQVEINQAQALVKTMSLTLLGTSDLARDGYDPEKNIIHQQMASYVPQMASYVPENTIRNVAPLAAKGTKKKAGGVSSQPADTEARKRARQENDEEYMRQNRLLSPRTWGDKKLPWEVTSAPIPGARQAHDHEGSQFKPAHRRVLLQDLTSTENTRDPGAKEGKPKMSRDYDSSDEDMPSMIDPPTGRRESTDRAASSSFAAASSSTMYRPASPASPKKKGKGKGKGEGKGKKLAASTRSLSALQRRRGADAEEADDSSDDDAESNPQLLRTGLRRKKPTRATAQDAKKVIKGVNKDVNLK